MPLDAISLSLEIAGRIEAQIEKVKQNRSKLRQLALQSIAISNDIREHYAALDEQNIDLPKSIRDAISEFELILGKVLKAVEKEQNRTRFKVWIKPSSQAERCSSLSEELTACATRFGMAANIHILGQTRTISIKQSQIAARDEELLRIILAKTTTSMQPLQRIVQFEDLKAPFSSPPLLDSSSTSSGSQEGAPDSQNETLKGFEGFLECLDQAVLSDKTELMSPLHEIFTFFLQHLGSHHQGLSICYAAAETFVIEYSDELKVCACVAVLKEDYDLRPNYDARAGNLARCRNDFIFDFTLLTVTDTHTSPSDWIQIQGLSNYFKKERVAYALWDLGRLPPASHIPDSDSFRWIKQQLSTIPTECLQIRRNRSR